MNDELKRAIIEAKWDRKNRMRESFRALLGAGFILVSVVVGLLVLSNLHRM